MLLIFVPHSSIDSTMRHTGTHGGKRAGAGRSRGTGRYGEPTQAIRVPESCVPAVKQMLGQVVALRRYPKGAGEVEVLQPASNPLALARPLFSCSVPAGFPSPADDYIEGQLDLNEYFVEHPAATFYVRVTGESMTGAGIFPDDILVVDRSLDAQHGKIVIGVVNRELTVKRLYRRDGVIELRPENPAFPAILCKDDMELVIWGVVTGVLRKC